MAPHTLEKGDFNLTEDPEKRLTAAPQQTRRSGAAWHSTAVSSRPPPHDREEGVSTFAIDPLAPLVLLLRLDR